MLEKDVGKVMRTAFQKKLWKIIKLHNTELQRGLPDYVMWNTGLPIINPELKTAKSGSMAINHLTPNQKSVLVSQSLSHTGSIVVFGDKTPDGYVAGFCYGQGGKLDTLEFHTMAPTLEEAMGTVIERLERVLKSTISPSAT